MDESAILKLLQKIITGMTKEQFLRICELVYDLVTKK